MITGEGKAVCDKEVGSPRRGWRTCNRVAHHTVKSKHGAVWLNYCDRHLPCGELIEVQKQLDAAFAENRALRIRLQSSSDTGANR